MYARGGISRMKNEGKFTTILIKTILVAHVLFLLLTGIALIAEIGDPTLNRVVFFMLLASLILK